MTDLVSMVQLSSQLEQVVSFEGKISYKCSGMDKPPVPF